MLDPKDTAMDAEKLQQIQTHARTIAASDPSKSFDLLESQQKDFLTLAFNRPILKLGRGKPC